MRFRLGLVTGFAAGYYLGARAGRERYEQINRTLRRIQGSDAYETAVEKAKEATSVATDKAKDVMDTAVEKVRHGDDVVAQKTDGQVRTPTLPDPWPETPRP